MRSDELCESVTAIIEDVRNDGDESLRRYAKEFDGASLSAIQVPGEEMLSALRETPGEIVDAFEIAVDQIRGFHAAQMASIRPTKFDRRGVVVEDKWNPIKRVGAYVPGGRYSYPSTVFMTTIPALTAGVNDVCVMTPPSKTGLPSALTLAACAFVGIDKVYCSGGAQAIAALAYGTESVGEVDLIAGPGNAWVNEAKRQVFGAVGIDALAGPSDVLIILDDRRYSNQAIASALAQSEHGPDSKATIFSTFELSDCMIENECLQTVKECVARAQEVAPEHLEIYSTNAESIAAQISTAGAIFLNTTSVLGDYIAGSNHVLPTNGSARFGSGLSVYTFMRRASVIRELQHDLRQPAATIAAAEGMTEHAESLKGATTQ